MATQENSMVSFDENDSREWQEFHVVSSPYFHDLKNTLEFDRSCHALESLFLDLQSRVDAFEKELKKFKI